MTEQLKPLPCPFCGSAPKTSERPDNIDGTRFFYAVVCYCGGYSACAHKMAVEPTPEQAKHAAIEAWNRRAQPAQAGQVPSDVRADFERARADGAFSPAADCCPTWYATELRFEGWSAAIAAQGDKT